MWWLNCCCDKTANLARNLLHFEGQPIVLDLLCFITHDCSRQPTLITSFAVSMHTAKVSWIGPIVPSHHHHRRTTQIDSPYPAYLPPPKLTNAQPRSFHCTTLTTSTDYLSSRHGAEKTWEILPAVSHGETSSDRNYFPVRLLRQSVGMCLARNPESVFFLVLSPVVVVIVITNRQDPTVFLRPL